MLCLGPYDFKDLDMLSHLLYETKDPDDLFFQLLRVK